MRERKRVDILSADIDSVSYDEALKLCKEFLEDDQQHYVVTPNPEMVMHIIDQRLESESVVYSSASMWNILRMADLAIPDGVGLIFADKILGAKFNDIHFKKRVSGVDLMMGLCEEASKTGKKIFLLGGAPGVAENAAGILQEKFRGLEVIGAEESYDSTPKYDEDVRMQILVEEPDIVFVAFGAGKQEYWISRNLPHSPSVSLMMGVGGALDFLVGAKALGAGVQIGPTRRAPKFIQKMWLEWLWRLILSPWRWRRIYKATFVFLWWVVKYRLVMEREYRPNVMACVYRYNESGEKEVLLCSREDDHDHWQMVQGGIDEGESEEAAVIREMKEEIGVIDRTSFRIERKLSEVYRYRWPFSVQWYRHHKKQYIGQEQRLFLVQYFGDRDDIDLRGLYTDDDLFYEYQWVRVSEFVDVLHPLRREAGSYFVKYLE